MLDEIDRNYTNRDKAAPEVILYKIWRHQNALFLMPKRRQMSKVRSKILYHGAHISVGCLALLLFAIFACPGFSGANAILAPGTYENAEDVPEAHDATGQLTRVYVKPSISISLTADMVEMDVDSKFTSKITDINVATNSTAGVQVLVNTDASTDLIETSDSSKTIPTIEKTTTQANFPTTGWGYYVGDTNPTATSEYQPVKTAATVAKTTTTSGAKNTFKLSVGVRASGDVAQGLYTNRLIVSAIANPIAVSTLYGLTYMQDMRPEICAATQPYVDVNNYAWKTLIDSRDSKEYKVAKLKDGNCWMTQNLALNGGFTLTSANSDVATSWAMPTTSTSSGAIGSNSANIESRNPSNYPNYWYYTWPAATANSSTKATVAGVIAPDSICPKGWQLPLSGTATINGVSTNTDTTSGSFKYLLNAQGINTATQMNNAGLSEPLTFVRLGHVHATSGVTGVGSSGFYWSRVASSGTDAYDFYWDSTSLTPSYSSPRHVGFSIRCIARQVAR